LGLVFSSQNILPNILGLVFSSQNILQNLHAINPLSPAHAPSPAHATAIRMQLHAVVPLQHA
jgi:hypothetical protein